MDEAPQEQPRRSKLGALLVFLAIGGSAAGVFIYQMMQGSRKTNVDASGFDIAQTTESSSRQASSAVAPQAQSSLGMVATGMTGIHFGKSTTPSAPASSSSGQAEDSERKAADAFSELCVQNEAKTRAFAEKATRSSPSLQRYGKEWMSYPDLKKLNDDYMRNHDAIAFLRGLTRSENFPVLVKKYARDPSVQQFVQAAMKQAPRELMDAGIKYVNKDNIVKDLVNKVIESLGLPPGMLGAAAGGGQVDANKIMGSVLGNNPQMQKALDSNPEIQKKLKEATHTPQPDQVPR